MSRLGEIQVLLDHLSNETNLLHQAKLRRKIQKMFKEQAECVEKLEEQTSDYQIINKNLHDRIKKYRKQNDRYKHALEFYASEEKWFPTLTYTAEGDVFEGEPLFIKDIGDIARQALKEDDSND